MFTVIFLNKRSTDLLQNYKFLFKPFLDDGSIAFCGWNESGTDIRSSVPDLYDLVKGKKEWRAVILNTDSVYDYKSSPAPKKSNPFDYTNVDSEKLPHESPVPVIRLTHIIGGYSALPVKEFDKGFEYTDIFGDVHRVKADDISVEELRELTDKYDDIKDIYMEREHSQELLEGYQDLAEKYCFSDIRPYEITLIATKKKCVDDEKARIKDSWSNHLEMNSSAFWETNKYPNNCRFMFYELSNVDNSLYLQELTEFWLSVLTFSVNKVTASTLQAYRLYKLYVKVSQKELSSILNGHLNRLTSAYASVKQQLRLRPEYTFEEDDEVIVWQPVPVTIEKANHSDMYLTFGKIGLCRDCPGDEYAMWTTGTKQKKDNFEKFLKIPRRSIDKSAQHLKAKADSYTGEVYELDKFQIEDLHEQMQELEQEIFAKNTSSIINRRELMKQIDSVTHNVKREIAYRLTKSLAIGSGLIALLICFSGFIPYLIQLGRIDSEHFFAGLGVALAVILFSAIGGLAVLIFQRMKIVKIMKEFNNVMRRSVNGIITGAKKFEDYFSIICTYMRAQSIFDGARKNKESFQSRSGKLNNHRHALAETISRDEQWIFAYSIERVEELIPSVTTYFDPNVIPAKNSIYFFEACLDEIDIPINDTGDTVFAPYRFIESLHIEREDIYDEEEIG